MNIASVRILRLAAGTALSLWFSQIYAWELSFIAPVITLLMLSLPMPAPGLKGGIAFVAVLSISMYTGLLLLPMLLNQPLAGLLLLILALFWSFYFTAKGGSMLIGTFATVGIAVTTAIGTVSVDAVLAIINYMSVSAFVGVIFVWIAHMLLPDSIAIDAGKSNITKPPPPPAPALEDARWSAYRSTIIVLPIALLFLFSASSAAYVPVMLKVASMGQQVGRENTKVAAHSLLMSTIIGGIGAIVAWQVLTVVPVLSMYTLLVALAALIMGPKIFRGAGMQADGATWSYGFLTMIVILAPAVMDSIGGAAAGVKFWQRLAMFAVATAYAVIAVSVFDAFRPKASTALAQQS
jgi:hypothetical protein